MIENFNLRIFLFALITIKNISNATIKRYGDIGSPWRALLSSLKYLVECPPITRHDSWFFSYVNPIYKIVTKTIFFKSSNDEAWFIQSKAFSKSIVIKYPLNFSIWHTSIISEINAFLPINVPLT